jgi:hypothetical protein
MLDTDPDSMNSDPKVAATFFLKQLSVPTRVADPYHFNADAEPSLHFTADLDTNTVPNQGDENLRPLIYSRVSDLDRIRIQSGQWIRIQEGENDPQKLL